MRQAFMVAMMLVAGCSPGTSEDSHFKPNSKAMVVNDSGSSVTALVAGGSGLGSYAWLSPGTMVIIESDDAMTNNMEIGGVKKPRRFVEIVVTDGQYKGIRAEIDFTNLRAIPD